MRAGRRVSRSVAPARRGPRPSAPRSPARRPRRSSGARPLRAGGGPARGGFSVASS